MDKYDLVSVAAEAARTAINDFADKFESAANFDQGSLFQGARAANPSS